MPTPESNTNTDLTEPTMEIAVQTPSRANRNRLHFTPTDKEMDIDKAARSQDGAELTSPSPGRDHQEKRPRLDDDRSAADVTLGATTISTLTATSTKPPHHSPLKDGRYNRLRAKPKAALNAPAVAAATNPTTTGPSDNNRTHKIFLDLNLSITNHGPDLFGAAKATLTSVLQELQRIDNSFILYETKPEPTETMAIRDPNHLLTTVAEMIKYIKKFRLQAANTYKMYTFIRAGFNSDALLDNAPPLLKSQGHEIRQKISNTTMARQLASGMAAPRPPILRSGLD